MMISNYTWVKTSLVIYTMKINFSPGKRVSRGELWIGDIFYPDTV